MVTGVEFDEDKMDYSGFRSARRPDSGGTSSVPYPNMAPRYPVRASGMPGWLIAHGWVKSEGAAQGVLIAIVIANIIITYIVVKYFLL